MKQNVFYLDESGGFRGNRKKQDLVGGFFSTREVTDETIRSFFEKLGYSDFHGMEIDDNAEYSRVLDRVIGFCNEKKIEPVLFISTRGFYIIDDSTTYLNVITDGMVKWLIKNLPYVKTCTTINMVIERRINTDNREYEKRLRERLAKETYLNQSLRDIPSFNLEFGNKNTPSLWLSDAIVHGYYRRKDLNNDTREAFEKWIHPNSLYVYRENPGDRIREYFNDENVLQGLVRLTDNYSNDPGEYGNLADEITGRVAQYPAGSVSAVMEQLIAFFMDRINTGRDLDTVEYVDTWIRTLLPLLQEKTGKAGVADPADLDWCYLRFYEVLVNAYNHAGAVKKAEQAFAEVDEKVKHLELDLSTYQSWARLQVLRGVHLTNMYCYDETISLMKELDDHVGQALSFLDESSKNITVKPSIAGEIKGTMLQAMMYRSAETKKDRDEVRALSDELLDMFPLQQDRNRQLQYRSQLEAYANDIDKARTYLALALGMEYRDDAELCGKVLERGSSFELLHFLRVWYMEIAANRMTGKEYYETLNALRQKHSQNYEKIIQADTYPVHTILRYLMVIHYAAGTGGAVEKAGEYYNRAVELCRKDDAHVTLLTLAMGIMADRASVLMRAGKEKEAGKARKELLEKAGAIYQQVKDTPVAAHVRHSIEEYENTPVENWLGKLRHLYPQ